MNENNSEQEFDLERDFDSKQNFGSEQEFDLERDFDSEQNFNLNEKIAEVAEQIQEYEAKIKKIAGKTGQNLKQMIYDLIVNVYGFMLDCNGFYSKSEKPEEEPVFEMGNDDKNKVLKQVIEPFIFLLKDMTEKGINCESDYYPLLTNRGKQEYLYDILILIKNYCSDEFVSQNVAKQLFEIIKNIMVHKKNLLLKAIDKHEIENGFLETDLQTTFDEILQASILFSTFFEAKERYEFVKSFYDDIFSKLVKVLNGSYKIKMETEVTDSEGNKLENQTIEYQYENQLMGCLFYVITLIIYKHDPYAAYIIGNLFIEKYYNDTKNQKYLYVPYLMSFIQNEFDSDVRTDDSDYFQKKLKLIKGRIDILSKNAVKKIDDRYIDYYITTEKGKHIYGCFGFTPDELFGIEKKIVVKDGEPSEEIVAIDPDDETAEKFRLNMDYVGSLEDALKLAWRDCNELFHQYRKEYMEDANSKAELDEKYQRIRKDRMDIYDTFRDLETEKQKLLKSRLTGLIGNNFLGLSKTEKILRSAFLILTSPIHVVIFICVKTLRRFFHCVKLGFEAICKFYLSFQGGRTCKDYWAEDCELNLDGLKINDNEEIRTRIKRYETKNWLLLRRILFPIDLVIHILIGIFAAIKKFFTSIKKYFETFGQVWKDIWDDDAFSHIFKKGNKSEVICNERGRISVLQKAEEGDIKVRNKFIDMSCPRVPYYDFSKKPKSIWNHTQCMTGFKSIKNAEEYDRYAHEHSGIPRLYYGQPDPTQTT